MSAILETAVLATKLIPYETLVSPAVPLNKNAPELICTTDSRLIRTVLLLLSYRGENLGGKIRTCDLLNPNQERYQTALHLENNIIQPTRLERVHQEPKSCVLPLDEG